MERRWVIAFDATTGERTGFVSCPKGNAAFYQADFELKGYIAKIYTSEEVDVMVENINNGEALILPPDQRIPSTPYFAKDVDLR